MNEDIGRIVKEEWEDKGKEGGDRLGEEGGRGEWRVRGEKRG
jgi:hypothetical protein